MDAAQRASFRENGYLVLRQAVDPAHIEALRALFDQHAIPEVREGPADPHPTHRWQCLPAAVRELLSGP